jgi:hypothetical protein
MVMPVSVGGMSPDCKAHGPKVVAVPQVPMTWCDVCPAVAAAARVGVVVESVTLGVNHNGHVPRTKFVTEPPLGAIQAPAASQTCVVDPPGGHVTT